MLHVAVVSNFIDHGFAADTSAFGYSLLNSIVTEPYDFFRKIM